MHSNFRYDSKKLCIAKFRRDWKFSLPLRNFRNAIAKFQPPALPSAPGFLHLVPFQLDISSSRLEEIAENSYELGINQHQYEAKLEVMAEVLKTCKTTKNNLETESIVLIGPAHVNRLNSYD